MGFFRFNKKVKGRVLNPSNSMELKINVALFGFTAKEWRENNPDKNGNIRDSATLPQLVVLSNMEV